MSSENALPDSSLPVKVDVADVSAPPTLAEPASGPVAEMSGALGAATGDEKPAGDAPRTDANGASESATKPASGSPPAQSNDLEAAAPSAEQPSAPSDVKPDTASQEKADEPATGDNADEAASKTNGGVDSKASSSKRKSSGVPEHNKKKLNKKKSIAKITHLDAKPGDHFFARLRSYPPWPSIICDQDMLPSSLLNTRPITAMKEDGTFNEAYADGGKKVNERTYPVMFLYTNEFAWIPNTDLGDLDPEACKDVPEKGKTKSLLAAYEIASQNNGLEHFRNMLMEHANALAEDEARKQEAAEAKASKAKDKKKRKSEAKAKPAADEDEDVEMEDAEDAPAAKKSSKKRKKAAESDGEEPEKPAKTPKTQKLKLTTKAPATDDKKKKEKGEKPAKSKGEKRKSKAAPVDDDEEMADAPEEETPKPIDPVAERKAREKEVLFLRHKLQKGFLSRDQAPQEDDMPQMANYIKKLEDYEDLEVAIIRTTKINKVLKALVKLNTIPRDEEFSFRKRSVDLLGKWNKALGAEPQDDADAAETKETAKSTPATNGVHEETNNEQPEEEKEEKKEQPAPSAATAEGQDEKTNQPATVPALQSDSAPDAQTDAQSTEQPQPAGQEPKTEAPATTAEAPVSAAEGTTGAATGDDAAGKPSAE